MDFEITVLASLRAAARRFPDAVATLVDGGNAVTFRDLEQRSERAAAALRARGIGPGDRVAAVAADDRWDAFVVACYAVYKSGAAVVPLSAALPVRAMNEALAETRARLAVTPDVLARLVGEGGRERPRGAGPENAGPENLAYVVRTSGTTGRPKLVAVTYGNLAAQYPVEEPVTGSPAVLMTVSIGSEATQGLVHDCVKGIKLVVPGRFDPARHCALIAEHRARVVGLVPSSATALVAAAEDLPHDFSSVRCVISSSAPLPPVLFERLAAVFPGAEIFNAYTLTEGVSLVNAYSSGRPGSIGRPEDDTELRIVGEDGRTLPAGEVGEIWLRQAGVTPRRHLSPHAGATRILPDGWVATGDMGYADDAGFVYLVDRRDDLVTIAGHNVSTVEVEAVLCEHPAVLAAAVTGLSHDFLGTTLAAAVTLRAPAAPGELYAHCADRLAPHARPASITVVGELPLTPTGKVRKQAVRELVRGDATAGGIAGEVRRAWAEALGRDVVAAEENLLDAGAYSLLATQVAVRLSAVLDRHVPVALVLEHPTAAALARAIADSPVVPRRSMRDRPARVSAADGPASA